ncbi:MAG: hypothetical protein AMXMBFR7_23140 [Planctomycetota bacterium]
MPILKDRAIVLRTYEVQNTSLVLVLLGRRLGQIRVLAKGARRWQKRGFEHGFDLLVEGELVCYPRPGDGLWIFKEWDERARPADLGLRLPAFGAACFLCEFAEALTRETSGSGGEQSGGADDEPLYELLRAAIEALDEGVAPGAVLIQFTLQALEAQGFLPDLDCCGACGAELNASRRPARLSPEGLVCEACLAGEALEKLPVGAAPPGDPRDLARLLDAAPGSQPAAVVWISPELLAALKHIKRTGKPVRLSATAARLGARTLVALVHHALEQDLRTLRAAARAVLALGPRKAPPARSAPPGARAAN